MNYLTPNISEWKSKLKLKNEKHSQLFEQQIKETIHKMFEQYTKNKKKTDSP